MKRWQAVVRAGWLVVVAAVIGASATPTAAAAPVEIYRYPPGHASAVQLAGHGFGHGIGMSQWGANGAATRGLTWRQIVGFYYPGTSPSSWSGAALKIRLDQLGTASTYLKPSPGLQIQIGRPAVRTTLLPVTAPTGKAATAYRILPTGVTLRVQVSDGTVWSDWDVTQNGSVPSTPFVVSRPDGGPITSLAVRDTANRAKTPTLRAYRGVLVSYPGSAASSWAPRRNPSRIDWRRP